jgi:hypothetical protein
MDEMIETDEEIFEDSFIVRETDSRVWIEQYGLEICDFAPMLMYAGHDFVLRLAWGIAEAANRRGVENRVGFLFAAIERGGARKAAAEKQSQKATECSFCKDSGPPGMRRIISKKYPCGAWKWCSHDPEKESKFVPAD